jgi:hypothetical protein
MFKSLIETVINDEHCRATFIIPREYSIPGEIQQLTGNEFAAYLSIIAATQCEIRSRGAAMELGAEEVIQQRIALSIAKEEARMQQEAMKKYDEGWALWREERDRLGAQVQRLQLQLQRCEQQLEDDKRRARESVENEYKGMIAELKGVAARTAEDYTVKLAASRAAADEMVQFYKNQLTTSNERAAALEEKLFDRTAAMKSSVRRGRYAEEEFAAQAAANGWNCERTADTSHCGDYTASIAGLTVMFEIKNYTNVVPAKEVQKFRRDMDEHREIHAGIFITMETEISGMRGDSAGIFKTEWTSAGQLLVFMTQFSADAVGNFAVLDKVLHVAAAILLKDQDVDDSALRLQRGLKYLEGAQDKLRNIINRITIDKRTAEDNYAQSLVTLKLLREEILMIFQMLSGEAVEEPAAPLEGPVVPLGPVKPRRKKKENLN